MQLAVMVVALGLGLGLAVGCNPDQMESMGLSPKKERTVAPKAAEGTAKCAVRCYKSRCPQCWRGSKVSMPCLTSKCDQDMDICNKACGMK